MGIIAVFIALGCIVVTVSIIYFLKRIRFRSVMNTEKRKHYKILRSNLAAPGGFVVYLVAFFRTSLGDFPILLAIVCLVALVGYIITLYGCYYWAKLKNRTGWWALCGLFIPLGFVLLMSLEDRYVPADELTDNDEEFYKKTIK